MKKLLTILLSALMVLALVGCDSNKEETITLEEPIKQEEIVEDDTILGGFTEAEDKTLTDELKEIFAKACESYTGISLKPERLEGTQVVAGTNYKFLASGTKTTNPPIKGSYFVTVYKDLQGNCSIIDVETVTESTVDVSNYNYWVVFYNPDGMELQRTAQKLGTTPKYEGEEPHYWDSDYWYKFVCWTDKKGNEITDFKPITGNTYIYAKYKIGGENKPEPKASAPAPTPAPVPSHTCRYDTDYLVYCIGVGDQMEIAVYDKFDGIYYYWKNVSDLNYSGDLSIGQWSHSNSDFDSDNIQFTFCDDYEAHTIDPCFPAGTQVQYDLLGHTKNIEDFKVGDQIASYDVKTNEYYLAKVGKLFVHDGLDKTNKLADVTLEDGSVITMTPNHPVLTTAGFRAIDSDTKPKLCEGQFVMTADGWTKISKINVYSCEPTTTYNLGLIDYDEIVDNDTYDTYVAGGIVVHNLK